MNKVVWPNVLKLCEHKNLTNTALEEGREYKDVAAESSDSCFTEVGITVGVVVLLVFVVGVYTMIATMLTCWR